MTEIPSRIPACFDLTALQFTLVAMETGIFSAQLRTSVQFGNTRIENFCYATIPFATNMLYGNIKRETTGNACFSNRI